MMASSLFFQLLLLVLGLVIGTNATLKFTNPSFELLTAGAPFNVTWSGAAGTTTLTLVNATATGMTTVNTVAFGISNSYILWSPYATTPTGLYVLRLDDSVGQSAYSAQFVMLPSGAKTNASTGLQFTNTEFDGITAGQPFNVTWDGANGSVALTLQQGTGNSITDVDVIASGIKTSFLNWSPYATTPAAQYVLKLVDSAGTIAYSTLFNMLAAGSSSSYSISSASSTSSSTSATSTATQTQTVASQTSAILTTPTSTPSSPSPALSTGAKAGIGIGSTIGGLAIISTIILLYLRYYNITISKKKPSSSSSNSIMSFGMPPVANGGVVHEKRSGMMNGVYESVQGREGTEVLEMGGAGESRPPVEMLAERGVHEIGGEGRKGEGPNFQV